MIFRVFYQYCRTQKLNFNSPFITNRHHLIPWQKKLLETRTILNNKEKLTVINYFEENGHSRTKTKDYFYRIHKWDIGVSTISKLYANKQQISERALSELDTFEGPKVHKTESLLLQWINTTATFGIFPYPNNWFH